MTSSSADVDTMPAWLLERGTTEVPTTCACCQHPLTDKGPQAGRHGVSSYGVHWTWCRRCDPWTDAAIGIKSVNGKVVYGPVRNEDGRCMHP